LAGTAISKLGGSDETAYIASMKSDAKNALAAVNSVYAAEQSYPTTLTTTSADKQGEVGELLAPSTSIRLAASPFNTVDYTFTAAGVCDNEVDLRITSSKTSKVVTYNSCTDGSIQTN
jgi:hypothetical protein